MKKIIFILMLAIMSAAAFAVTDDYAWSLVIDASAYTRSPTALESLPGGFIIVDSEGSSAVAYKYDAAGILLNQSGGSSRFNLTQNISSKVNGLRVFNRTGNDISLLLINGTKIIRLNDSNMNIQVPEEWMLPSNGTFSTTDVLSGVCTNGSNVWVAIQNRDVVGMWDKNGTNTSVNGVFAPMEYAIPGTDNADAFDCLDGNSTGTFFLERQKVIITKIGKNLEVLDTINITQLTGAEEFSDIAAVGIDSFYAVSNSTKSVYWIRRKSGIDRLTPSIRFTYPANEQVFSSAVALQRIQLNFSVSQTDAASADLINCSMKINQTINVSANAVSNISINVSVNISFAPGTYRAQIDCLANSSYAKRMASGPKDFTIKQYRTIVWINDNLSIYYNDNINAFQTAWGYNNTILTAFHNLTGNHIKLRLTWDNITGNRTIFIDGVNTASDNFTRIKGNRPEKLFIGSANGTGQANALISYMQISNNVETENFDKGSWISPFTAKFRAFEEGEIGITRYLQIKTSLKRSTTAGRPILKFTNISADQTLFNESMIAGISNLDFSFASPTSSALPAGHAAGEATLKVGNIGNSTFELRAASRTPFSSCFNMMLFNESDFMTAGSKNNTINLSTTPRTLVASLGPGKQANIWINVTATACSRSAEFPEIEFSTLP